ncbi:MAG TPA: ABC transporter [Firmicutes bacterium]|nr:ABC transporter [Bacillota bacterium]
MKNAIEIKNLTKRYDSKFQLGPIDLEIPSGEIIGLIGENGAGKTTLIKSILSILKPDTGKINIFGKSIDEDEASIKEEIGVVLDDMFLPEILMPKDINSIMSDVYQNWSRDDFFKYLKEFQIPTDKTIKTLSKGMRKKLEIATALSHHPKLLILDEPTSGLDPVVRSEILDIFLDFISDDEHTILLSTHITTDLEHIADEIIFIDGGKVVLKETKDDIIDNYGILKCDHDYFEKIDKADIVVYKKNKYDYHILVKDASKMEKKYRDCIIDKLTLEDLMVLMIKGDKNEGTN